MAKMKYTVYMQCLQESFCFPFKYSLGEYRPWRRWKDNIRMDLEEIDINARNWVDSAQDRDHWRALVNAALNLRVT